jgi:uncharacterized membrane protein YdjX (TVP38/TMEM64 family)
MRDSRFKRRIDRVLGEKEGRVQRAIGWLVGIFFFFLLTAFFIWVLFFARDVSGFVKALGPWGPLFIILFHIAQIVFAPVPGHVIPLTSGYLYGFFWGAVYDAVGLVAGALLVYLIGLKLGRPVVSKLVGPDNLDKAEKYISGKRILLVFLAFALPGLPKDAMCYACGILKVPFRYYLLILFGIRIPGDLFVILWGGGFRLFEAKTLIWGGIASVIGIALFWVVGLWIKRRWFDEREGR